MSSLKIFTRCFAALAVSIALPVFAADAKQAAADAGAACKRARQDLFFIQQLAWTDGNTNPTLNALVPKACKFANQSSNDAAAERPLPAEKAALYSSSAARYN